MRGKSLRIELHLSGALSARFEGAYVEVERVRRQGATWRNRWGNRFGRITIEAARAIGWTASSNVRGRSCGKRCERPTRGTERRLQPTTVQYGTPGKSGPAIFAFLYPKPPLGSFTKSIQSSDTGKPSARNGPVSPGVIERHRRACADCFWSQLRRIGFGQPRQARPRRGGSNITTSGRGEPLKTGTFYFARKRNFLLCLDTIKVVVSHRRAVGGIVSAGSRGHAADDIHLVAGRCGQ